MSSLRVQAPLRGNVASRSASRPAARGCRRSLVVRAEAPAEKWPVMQSLLKQAAVPSVGVASVAEAQADGYVLVDVRPAEDFEQYHAPGAVSVPLFTPIKIDSPSKLMKQMLYSFNGMKGTDANLRFVEQVGEAVPSRSKVLVICDAGGTYLPVGVTLEGRRSRSLVGIYKLLASQQFSDVMHVAGGIRAWGEAGLPMEGTQVEGWRSKTGMTPRSD